MIVSIHQPTFFPHSGTLLKIARADLHVVLNQAQFSPGVYHNRFAMNGRWYTMAVRRGLEPLAVKRYADHARDWQAIKRRLPALAGILDDFDDCIGEGLAATNGAILRRLCARLGIGTEIVDDLPTDLRGTDRLVALCRHFGATTYLSGPSGPKYLDMDAFRAAGIRVEVQEAAPSRAAAELLAERGAPRAVRACGA